MTEEKRQQAREAVQPIVTKLVDDLAKAGASISVTIGDDVVESDGRPLLGELLDSIAEATGLEVSEFEDRVHSTIEQWEQYGGDLFDNLMLKVTGPEGERTFYIDADGWKVGDYDELTRAADPLWGDVLDDEVHEVERELTRPELDALLDAFGEAKRRESRAEIRAKDARAEHKVAKERLDEAAEQLLASKTTDAMRCPVRLRDGVLVVLHPETHAIIETREVTDADRQMSLPERSAEDEAAGVDRVQLRARLQEHEAALAISRGVHAVPPQVEIDAWPTGVCRATTEWLDSIDRGGQLKPLPVWVTGLRADQQVVAERYESEQVTAAEHQIDAAAGALISGNIDELPFGTVRLDLATVVAQMKRERVVKGTSQHLTAVLRMVADAGGLPQFNQAVRESEGARLRLIYFIAKAKPSAEGMDEADVRSAVVDEVGRMLEAS